MIYQAWWQLSVSCPVCHRQAGAICADPRGNGRWGRPHKTRAKLAKEKSMAQYKVTVPFQDDMGSIMPFHASSSPMETKEQNALWTINSMRDHDGLPHLTRMPVGTKFERID